MDRVEVDWIDSARSQSGWQTVEDARREAAVGDMKCRSIGYLLHEDELIISLASSISLDGAHVADYITIPKVTITSRRKVGKR